MGFRMRVGLLLVGAMGVGPSCKSRQSSPPVHLRSVTAGPRDPKAAPGPVLVLLHGYGSRPEDWLPFTQTLAVPPGTRFFFPESPEQTVPPDGPVGGRAWWRIDLGSYVDAKKPRALPDLSGAAPPGLERARQWVIGYLDELERTQGIPSSRIVLGGFSQGAMVALDVVLHDDRRLLGVALLSGTIVNEAAWKIRMARRKGTPVFLSHSPADEILPFAASERLSHELQGAGWRVTWLPFEGGHQIPAPVVEGLAAFVNRLSR